MPKPGSPILPKNPLLSSKNSPNLIELIQQDLASMGIVGEEDAALLVYLAYSSRKMMKPLSVIIKGPSGSGKSHLQRRTAELMPKADIIEATDITPQSLYYFTDGYLKHKILLGGERNHQEDEAQRDRTKSIRQLLSEGAIHKISMLNMESKEIHAEGPVSYSETTTQEHIFAEDAGRYVEIRTKPSPELSRQILKEKGKKYDKNYRRTDETRQSIKNRHWEFQNSIATYEVSIPYINKLESLIPTPIVEIHRLYDQLLTLIEVITHLHQFQREIDKDKFLEASLDDYIIAKRLMMIPFEKSLRQHPELDSLLPLIPDPQFTTDQATGAWDSNSRKVTHAKLKRLAEVGLIACVQESVGNKPAIWKKTGHSGSVLPSPESLIG